MGENLDLVHAILKMDADSIARNDYTVCKHSKHAQIIVNSGNVYFYTNTVDRDNDFDIIERFVKQKNIC
jgi:hypothetical protein